MPFSMAMLVVACAFATLGASFWPYMIPYSVTVQQAAAPPQSLEFLFWGAGIVLAYVLDPLANRLERLGLGRLIATLVILGLFIIDIGS
jgi:hypothetical protein